MITSSGQLNAKQRELLELQALAQRRLKGARSNFSEGIKVARETKRDLEWTQKRVKWVLTSANLFPLRSSLSPLPPGYSMIVVVGFRSALGLRRAPPSKLFLASHVRPICNSCEIKTRTIWSFLVNWLNFFYSGLKSKAEAAHPEEYRRASKKYTYDDEYWACGRNRVLPFDLVYISFLMTATNWPFLHKIGLWESGSVGILVCSVFAWFVIFGGSPSLEPGIYIFLFIFASCICAGRLFLFIFGLMWAHFMQHGLCCAAAFGGCCGCGNEVRWG